MSETLGIAELAAEFRVTTRTIRFYKGKDLVTLERHGQLRLYLLRDKVRLQLIFTGQAPLLFLRLNPGHSRSL